MTVGVTLHYAANVTWPRRPAAHVISTPMMCLVVRSEDLRSGAFRAGVRTDFASTVCAVDHLQITKCEDPALRPTQLPLCYDKVAGETLLVISNQAASAALRLVSVK